jgi:hypothetical protein
VLGLYRMGVYLTMWFHDTLITMRNEPICGPANCSWISWCTYALSLLRESLIRTFFCDHSVESIWDNIEPQHCPFLLSYTLELTYYCSSACGWILGRIPVDLVVYQEGRKFYCFAFPLHQFWHSTCEISRNTSTYLITWFFLASRIYSGIYIADTEGFNFPKFHGCRNRHAAWSLPDVGYLRWWAV